MSVQEEESMKLEEVPEKSSEENVEEDEEGEEEEDDNVEEVQPFNPYGQMPNYYNTEIKQLEVEEDSEEQDERFDYEKDLQTKLNTVRREGKMFLHAALTRYTKGKASYDTPQEGMYKQTEMEVVITYFPGFEDVKGVLERVDDEVIRVKAKGKAQKELNLMRGFEERHEYPSKWATLKVGQIIRVKTNFDRLPSPPPPVNSIILLNGLDVTIRESFARRLPKEKKEGEKDGANDKKPKVEEGPKEYTEDDLNATRFANWYNCLSIAAETPAIPDMGGFLVNHFSPFGNICMDDTYYDTICYVGNMTSSHAASGMNWRVSMSPHSSPDKDFMRLYTAGASHTPAEGHENPKYLHTAYSQGLAFYRWPSNMSEGDAKVQGKHERFAIQVTIMEELIPEMFGITSARMFQKIMGGQHTAMHMTIIAQNSPGKTKNINANWNKEDAYSHYMQFYAKRVMFNTKRHLLTYGLKVSKETVIREFKKKKWCTEDALMMLKTKDPDREHNLNKRKNHKGWINLNNSDDSLAAIIAEGGWTFRMLTSQYFATGEHSISTTKGMLAQTKALRKLAKLSEEEVDKCLRSAEGCAVIINNDADTPVIFYAVKE